MVKIYFSIVQERKCLSKEKCLSNWMLAMWDERPVIVLNNICICRKYLAEKHSIYGLLKTVFS